MTKAAKTTTKKRSRSSDAEARAAGRASVPMKPTALGKHGHHQRPTMAALELRPLGVDPISSATVASRCHVRFTSTVPLPVYSSLAEVRELLHVRSRCALGRDIDDMRLRVETSGTVFNDWRTIAAFAPNTFAATSISRASRDGVPADRQGPTPPITVYAVTDPIALIGAGVGSSTGRRTTPAVARTKEALLNDAFYNKSGDEDLLVPAVHPGGELRRALLYPDSDIAASDNVNQRVCRVKGHQASDVPERSWLSGDELLAVSGLDEERRIHATMAGGALFVVGHVPEGELAASCPFFCAGASDVFFFAVSTANSAKFASGSTYVHLVGTQLDPTRSGKKSNTEPTAPDETVGRAPLVGYDSFGMKVIPTCDARASVDVGSLAFRGDIGRGTKRRNVGSNDPQCATTTRAPTVAAGGKKESASAVSGNDQSFKLSTSAEGKKKESVKSRKQSVKASSMPDMHNGSSGSETFHEHYGRRWQSGGSDEATPREIHNADDDDDDAPPELVPKFVLGGDDES